MSKEIQINLNYKQCLLLKEVLARKLNRMWNDLNNPEIPEGSKELVKEIYISHKLELRSIFEQIEEGVEMALEVMRSNGCPDETMQRVIKGITLEDPYVTLKNLH